MSIKEKVENNVFWVIGGSVITLTSLIYLAVTWYYSKELELQEKTCNAKIQDLEAKLSSIERNIGDEKYFNPKKFFYEDEIQDPNITFLPKGEIYAQTKLEGFTFGEYSELESIMKMISLTQNISQADMELLISSHPVLKILTSEKYKSIVDLTRTYTWTSTDSIKYYYKGVPQKAFQYMSVEVSPVAFEQRIGFIAAIEEDEQNKNILGTDTNDNKATKEMVKKQNRVDVNLISFMGIAQSKIQQAKMDEAISIRLEKLQKIDDVLYMKSVLKKTGCSFEGEENMTYYETEEMILISNNNQTYYVRSVIPGFEPLPKASQAAKLNIWLNNLKFPAK